MEPTDRDRRIVAGLERQFGPEPISPLSRHRPIARPGHGRRAARCPDTHGLPAGDHMSDRPETREHDPVAERPDTGPTSPGRPPLSGADPALPGLDTDPPRRSYEPEPDDDGETAEH